MLWVDVPMNEYEGHMHKRTFCITDINFERDLFHLFSPTCMAIMHCPFSNAVTQLTIPVFRPLSNVNTPDTEIAPSCLL